MKVKAFWKEHMAKKKTVRFEIIDGKTPTRGPGGVFNILAPMRLDFGGKVRVKTGIKCDHPVHIIPLANRPFKLVDGVWAAQDANQEIVLEMEPSTGTYVSGSYVADKVMLETGETLARCFVVDNTDIELG